VHRNQTESNTEEEKYDVEAIQAYLREHSQTADLFLCTSPFTLCALGSEVSNVPFIGYLGLPTIWKTFGIPIEDIFKLGRQFLKKAVVVVNNPLLGEQMDYQFSTRIPLFRPLAQYTNVTWKPSQKAVLLVARSKFFFFTLQCFIPHFTPDDFPLKFLTLNTEKTLSFDEMSTALGAIIFPWEHVLMAFYEYYAMNMPIFLPAKHWLYRLSFNRDGNLGRTTGEYDVIPEDPNTGKDPIPQHQHPYRPFAISKFDAQRYWIHWSEFILFPHVIYFENLQELMHKLLTIDYQSISQRMAEVNIRRREQTIHQWSTAIEKLNLIK